jgi:hypothetical protein
MFKDHRSFTSAQKIIAVTAMIFVIALTESCTDRGADPPAPPVVPTITGVFPESLRVSEVVEIRGTGFERYEQSYAVVFSNNVSASVYLHWEDTEIRCVVPQGAITGTVRVQKNSLRSNDFVVLVVGAQSTQLILSQTSVSVNSRQSTTVTVSGGMPPYTIQTGPNTSIATATISGSTVTISGVGQGTAAVVIADATSPTPLTVTLPIQVNAQAGVSFSQQIVSIFNASCVGCHGGTANLFLTSSQAYGNLVNVPAQTGTCSGTPRVTPGNSSQSALFLRVNGTCSDRMPLEGSLSQSDIDLIRQWIDQGALNN